MDRIVDGAPDSRPRRPEAAPLVLVVEDDPAVQLMLISGLRARGLRVHAVDRGAEALRFLSLQEPQIIIVDLGLPDFDGIDLVKRMRPLVKCPIIVESGDSEDSRMVAALDNGADDYLVKPYAIDVLLARVRVALRHVAAMSGTVDRQTFEVGDLIVDVPAHMAVAGGNVLELSPRQFRLLTALVRNLGLVLTHKQLALVSSADGDDGTSADGLRGAMSHLRKRLGSGPRRPFIVTEPQVGYRLMAPGDMAP